MDCVLREKSSEPYPEFWSPRWLSILAELFSILRSLTSDTSQQMHFAFLLSVASIIPGLAERFHTARLHQIAGGGSDVPDLDEVKKWAAFFVSEEGGGMSYRNARDQAFETLAERSGWSEEVVPSEGRSAFLWMSRCRRCLQTALLTAAMQLCALSNSVAVDVCTVWFVGCFHIIFSLKLNLPDFPTVIEASQWVNPSAQIFTTSPNCIIQNLCAYMYLC